MERFISKAELQDMLQKYNIGKKPLAALLGWGETTILIYMNQDEIPKNEYSDRLYRLYASPGEYLDLLINNQNNISDVAFRKSLSAVTENINNNKLLSAAQYVLDISEDYVSVCRLQNILMWSQIISLVLFDKALFPENYQPTRGNYPYKTVVTFYETKGFLFSDIRKSTNGILENHKKVGMSFMTLPDENEKLIIRVTADMFAWYGDKALSQLLAAERFRLCGPPTQNRKRIVSNDLMKKKYQEVFEQARIKKIKDVQGFMAKRLEALRKLR